jgi:hypothetical protein
MDSAVKIAAALVSLEAPEAASIDQALSLLSATVSSVNARHGSQAAEAQATIHELRKRCSDLEDAVAYGDAVMRQLEHEIELHRLDAERRAARALTLRDQLSAELVTVETESLQHTR